MSKKQQKQMYAVVIFLLQLMTENTCMPCLMNVYSVSTCMVMKCMNLMDPWLSLHGLVACCWCVCCVVCLVLFVVCVCKMWQEFCCLGRLARGGVLPLEECWWCCQGHTNDLPQWPVFFASAIRHGSWCHLCACWRNSLPWYTEVSFLDVCVF